MSSNQSELHDETVSKEKQQQKEAKDKVMQHSADTFGMENCGRWEKETSWAPLRSSSLEQEGSSSLVSTDKLYFQPYTINSF